jgi:hypothetical protein
MALTHQIWDPSFLAPSQLGLKQQLLRHQLDGLCQDPVALCTGKVLVRPEQATSKS